MTDEERHKKLIAARARYGRPWITELMVDRVKEPSEWLRRQNERAPRISKVTQMRDRKHGR